MESKKDLFARYDPLEKTNDLFSRYAPDGEMLLSIRPVCIISDLIVLHEWLDAELCKTNWHLNRRRMTVMQHYKQLLLSFNAQSLMLEQGNHQTRDADRPVVTTARWLSEICRLWQRRLCSTLFIPREFQGSGYV